MVSYSTSDFRVGLKILIDNDPCVIIEEEFNKPGKGQAFSKIKFRNYLTGRVGEKTCKVGESLESADIVEIEMQYLYSEGTDWCFMNQETYEGGSKPATLSTGAIVKVPLFISEGETITVDTRNGEYQGRK